MSNFTKLSISLFVCIFALTSISTATVMWTDPNGSAGLFDWANGGSDTGLFGDPTIVGNTLTFAPSNFKAEAANGEMVEVWDTLHFDIIVHPGSVITGIIIEELGDYSILGSGMVDVFSTVTVTNLDDPNVIYTNELTVNPLMPVDIGDGIWTAIGGIDNIEVTHIRVSLENGLLALADYGSIAMIEKKVVGDSIAITIIPEPATIVILGLGGFLLRKRTK